MEASLKDKLKAKQYSITVLNSGQNIELELYTGLEFENLNLILTKGLSKYKMDVPEIIATKSRVELCLLLPGELDLETLHYKDLDCKLLLQKISNVVVENKSWIGAGHTFPNISDNPTISRYTEMDHFMLIEPVLFKDELSGIQFDDEEVTVLAIIPIFKKELDFKLKNGAFNLLKRLNKNAVTELFEMKRPSSLKRKFFGL